MPSLLTELSLYSFYQKWESDPQKQRHNISVFLSTTKFSSPPIFTVNTCLKKHIHMGLIWATHKHAGACSAFLGNQSKIIKRKHLKSWKILYPGPNVSLHVKDFEVEVHQLLHKCWPCLEAMCLKFLHSLVTTWHLNHN